MLASHGNDLASLREFSPQPIDIDFDTHRQAVIVSADALLFWWGGDTGPQTASELIDQHLDEIKIAVTARLSAGAARDAPIVIGEEDFD